MIKPILMSQQRGAVLLISLILLVMISSLLFTAMQGLILEMRISHQVQQAHALQQAAIYTAKQAELSVFSLTAGELHPQLKLAHCANNSAAYCQIQRLESAEQLQQFSQVDTAWLAGVTAVQSLQVSEQIQGYWSVGWIAPYLLGEQTLTAAQYAGLESGVQYFVINAVSQNQQRQQVQLQLVVADIWSE